MTNLVLAFAILFGVLGGALLFGGWLSIANEGDAKEQSGFLWLVDALIGGVFAVFENWSKHQEGRWCVYAGLACASVAGFLALLYSAMK